MMFTREGVYFNPARADPRYMSTSTYETASGTMSYLSTSSDVCHDALIAVSSGMSGVCTLVAGGKRGCDDVAIKKIDLTLHALEFNNVANCMGRALGFTEADCAYFNSAVTVATQALFHAGSLSSTYSISLKHLCADNKDYSYRSLAPYARTA